MTKANSGNQIGRVVGSFVTAFIAVITILQAPSATAQDGDVRFHQDAGLDELVEFYSSHVRSRKLAPGFRVQILAGTSREKADKVKREFHTKYPGYESYLTYHSPYFKIRVGDFAERLAAHRFLHEIESTFPGAFLVEEEIRLE